MDEAFAFVGRCDMKWTRYPDQTARQPPGCARVLYWMLG